jgi:uncharacterized protein with LGFP repeats
MADLLTRPRRTVGTALGAGLLAVSIGVLGPLTAAPAAAEEVAAAVAATPSVTAPVAAVPGRPSSVRTIPLADATARQTTGGPTASITDSGTRTTAPFSMVGVSWNRASAANATFSVRTHTAGRWTGWSTLTTSDVAPDAGRSDDRASDRRTTEPLWVGASDGVQVRLGAAPRRIAGVRIELVDPGTSPTDARLATVPAAHPSSATATSATPALRAGTAALVATRAPGIAPPIISRAAWGADERLRSYNPNCSQPEYGTTVKMGFVHHTDNVNTYSAADVPGIVRAIYAYHVQSNHWCDVGYNFLVDRFGRIFEGRYGGTTLPVIGAHTGGFNTDTFAASMIGNFTSVSPPAAMLNAMADLYAWKLGSYYRNPTGKTVLTAGVYAGSRFPVGAQVTFNTISGHRDADFTDCPGNAAYALLPALRTMVAARLPRSAIAARYAALGGPAGILGEPILSGERAVPYGLMTQFQNGSITYATATGARMLSSAVTADWLHVGGVAGVLGYPVSDEGPLPDGRGRSAAFQRGYIHWSPSTGAHETDGDVAARYRLTGYQRGPLGYPQTDTTIRPDGVGRYNRFDNGYIFFTPATGAHEVLGVVLARWRALSFEAGVLGYPTTNPTTTPDTIGLYQHFQKGSVYWSPGTGAHEVRGAIRDRFANLGWERGVLGYPTTDERTVAPGVVQTDFQHGSISWNLATNATTVTTAP